MHIINLSLPHASKVPAAHRLAAPLLPLHAIIKPSCLGVQDPEMALSCGITDLDSRVNEASGLHVMEGAGQGQGRGQGWGQEHRGGRRAMG